MRWIPVILFYATVPLCAVVSIRAGVVRNWGLSVLAMLWTCRDGWLAENLILDKWFVGSYSRAWHWLYDPTCHILLLTLMDVALALVCFHAMARTSRKIYPWALGMIGIFGVLALGGAAVAYLASGEGISAPFLRPISMSRAYCGAFTILSIIFFSANFSTLEAPDRISRRQSVIAAIYFIGTFTANTLNSDYAIWERKLGAWLLHIVGFTTACAWVWMMKSDNGGTQIGVGAAILPASI